MTLKFRNLTIPGTHQTVTPAPPTLKTRNDLVWGQHGEIQVYGGQGGRPVSVTMVFHNSWTTEKKLEKALFGLLKLTGTNGTLKETGNVTRTFADCTFDGVEELSGPLEDIAGTIDGGWFIDIRLNFYQLKALPDVQVEA